MNSPIDNPSNRMMDDLFSAIENHTTGWAHRGSQNT